MVRALRCILPVFLVLTAGVAFGQANFIAYDLGAVPLNRQLSHVFELKNETAGPLVVENVEHGWGISYSLLPGGEVKEGESVKIEIRHTPCGVGRFEKFVILKLNKQPGRVVLKITGNAAE